MASAVRGANWALSMEIAKPQWIKEWYSFFLLNETENDGVFSKLEEKVIKDLIKGINQAYGTI